jgi:hypothetical protein
VKSTKSQNSSPVKAKAKRGRPKTAKVETTKDAQVETEVKPAEPAPA